MAEHTEVKEVKKFMFKHKMLGILVVLVVILAFLVAGYFYMQYQKTQQLLKNPTLAAQVQTQELLGAVGKLIDLPKETPTIATVSDISKLQGQPFFQNAKNGDKVLIYTNAKEAILYRPSDNKIIAVAPVNISQQVTPVPTGKITPTPIKKITAAR